MKSPAYIKRTVNNANKKIFSVCIEKYNYLCKKLTTSLHMYIMVDSQGIEPRMPEAPDLQSGVVTNATRHPNYF